MFIKWSMYPRQDLAFRMYCLNHVGCGYEAYIETVILLNQNDGNAIDEKTIVDCVQQITSIDREVVSDCVHSMVKFGLLKTNENGLLYSERVKSDVQERISLSEKRRAVSNKRWGLNPNASKHGGNSNAIGVQLDCNCNASKSKSKSKSKSNIEKEIVKEKTQRFVKPSLEEVKAYCEERNNHVDPEAFIAYYESNGWHVGRDKMHSWKSAVVTWEKRDKNKIASLPINKRPQVGYRPEDYKDVPETGIF